ncbi:MAG: PQQ-dependent sugar dehydrogenase [Chloroflexi bacterium]|nr:PQQ-dependent sugar dehydrogenase [Chloroflexota bacterium]
MVRRTAWMWLAFASPAVATLFVLLAVFNNEVLSAAPAHITFPTITLTPFAQGASQPTYVTHAGDNSGRLFVVERAGRIRIFRNGSFLSTPFLDITSRVQSASSEQGLLSVAFPPGYASKGSFYVNYTSRAGVGDTVIARYRLTGNADVADPDSEEVVLTMVQPQVNHNGGQLQFGPDGYLYIGMGDGGGGGDQHGTIGNAQDPSALLGKILRINVEPTSPNPGSPPPGSFFIYLPIISKSGGSFFTYSIPPTNPYTQTVGYRGEIWALGVRNPWRFSFDRQTGDLYIGDVGQNAWEEVNFQPGTSTGGENYGWRILEGNHCYNPPTGCAPPARYSAPVAEYANAASECSVTGGYVYRGPGNPAMRGFYFYGDFCSGRIWGLKRDGNDAWQAQELGVQPPISINISSFGEDQAGNLYVADFSSGTIYMITSP